MTILAIETSCDDTCIAIVKARGRKNPEFKVLSNIISSQIKIHKKWGGVYPTLAKREHQKNLPVVFKKAIGKAKSASWQTKINLIAVTVGPGLEPCLWVGVNFAKNLSKGKKIPLMPVNHIEAHILSNFVIRGPSSNKLFPAVCLVVSGGHTQLILMKDFGKYRILGETRDDAAGECFDKVARILGLGYPGGPAIAAEAAKLQITNYKLQINLPRPMIYQKNYDFSFSGLKTAVLYDFKSRPPRIRRSKDYIRAVAAEVQQAVIDVLVHKTLKAARNFKAKSIILGGGVSANDELRKQFKIRSLKSEIEFLVPPKNLSTDNAVMTAIAAYFNWFKRGKKAFKKIEAKANQRILK
jgi:N6-L-threonylcarbamoyladenine synthase